MKIRFLLIAALLITGLTAGPAAATSRSKQGAADTWAGQVVRHSSERLTPPGSGGHPPAPGRHFDYQGSYCPTSADACIKILAKFRIVPLNPRAAAALRKVAGGSAKLVGWRAPASDGEHNGILYVRRVKKA